MCIESVAQYIQGESLGVVHRGVKVGGRVFDVGAKSRERGKGLPAAVEPVPRHSAACPGESVIQGETDFDQERAPLAWFALPMSQETDGCGEHSGESTEDRDGGLQRLDIVGSQFQQGVTLHDRFADQAELAVLQVADSTVDHMRGRSGGTLAVVAALHEGHVHTLKRKVTEGPGAVDAAANDQHLCLGIVFELPDRRSCAVVCVVVGISVGCIPHQCVLRDVCVA